MREPVSTALLSVDAFSDLLASTQGALHGFVRGLLHDVEEARDVVQEVFADAWRLRQRGGAPFDGGSEREAMRRWLFHAAYCEAISVTRHRSVLIIDHLEDTDSDNYRETHPTQPFENRVLEAEVLRTVLSSLSSTDAACLLLNVIQGFTSSEIAPIAGITSEAAKRRVSRAKERLRRAYFALQAPEQESQR